MAPTLRPTVTQYHLCLAAAVRPIGSVEEGAATAAVDTPATAGMVGVSATGVGTIEADAVVTDIAGCSGFDAATVGGARRTDVFEGTSATRESALELWLLAGGDGRGREATGE
jgi:hypothetical protein